MIGCKQAAGLTRGGGQRQLASPNEKLQSIIYLNKPLASWPAPGEKNKQQVVGRRAVAQQRQKLMPACCGRMKTTAANSNMRRLEHPFGNEAELQFVPWLSSAGSAAPANVFEHGSG